MASTIKDACRMRTGYAEQYRKAWQQEPPATKKETEKLAKENQELRDRIAKLEGVFELVLKTKITKEN